MTLPVLSRSLRAARSHARGLSRFVSSLATVSPAVAGTFLVLLLAACGGGAGSRPGNSPDAPGDAEAQTRSYPRNRISRDEIMERGDNASNAMQVVRRLRPAWLLARGPDPVVYVDNVRRPGGVDALSNVPIGQIQLLEFIGASDATTRWGTGHTGGVIQVRTGG